MEILNKLLDFFTDSKRHYSARAVALFFVLGVIYLVNDITGYTYYSGINNKTERIKAINELIADSTMPKGSKQQLISLREEVLSRQNILVSTTDNIQKAYRELKSISFKRTPAPVARKEPNEVARPTQASVHPERNNLVFALSTSGIYGLLLVLMVPIGIYHVLVKSTRVGSDTIGVFIALIVLYGLGAFHYYLFGLIPLIKNNWLWNYGLNVFLQFALLGIIGIFGKKAAK